MFLGCEGASEGSYAAWLQSLIDSRDLPIALDIVILGPGVGDPHEIVRKAVLKADVSAERKGPHVGRYVLLDMDRHDATGDLGRRTLDLARKHDVTLVWQRPCHEALLLRHLPKCRDRRPTTTADAMSVLLRFWPAYEKAMSSNELAATIDEAAVMRAAQVEPELCDFLVAVGLIQARKGKGDEDLTPMNYVRALDFDVFGTAVDWRSGVTRDATPFLCRHGTAGADPEPSRTRGWPAIRSAWMRCPQAGAPLLGSTCSTARSSWRCRPISASIPPPCQRRRSTTSTSPGTGSTPGPTACPADAPQGGVRRSTVVQWRYRADDRLGQALRSTLACDPGCRGGPRRQADARALSAHNRRADAATRAGRLRHAPNDDLAPAHARGVCTAFLPRPNEHGPGQTKDLCPAQDWDAAADDVEALAGLLGL